MDALMSDNIWNSLSVSAKHRNERERGKVFSKERRKKKGIIFIGMRALAQIIINDRCCWSRFEISSDLFRQNRNRIFFPFFFLHITMNNSRYSILFFFYISSLLYTPTNRYETARKRVYEFHPGQHERILCK